MKKSYFKIISVIILVIVVSFDVKAQSSEKDKAGAKAFVQHFYDRFAGLIDEHTDINNYFDEPFKKAFNMTFKGDDIGYDFDPISNAQDDRSGFQTGNVKQVGNKFFVNIHDIAKGRSEKQILSAPICVTVETVKIGTSWKIANLIYPPYGAGKQTDLLTLAAHHKKFGY